MSGKNAAKKQEEETLPVPVAGAALPAEMMGMMQEDAGKGVSSAAEDNLVPLLYVLQALSPQVEISGPAQIQGAKPGDLWLRNARDSIVNGNDGFPFQPCYSWKDWVEWLPDRGGFVGRHENRPAEAQQDDQNKNKWRMPNGNSVVETRYVAGIAHVGNNRMPYIIPFSSTGHTVERGWNTARGTHKLPSGQPMPAFASLWNLSTVQRSNKKGKWYSIAPSWVSYVDKDTYMEGRALHDSLASGQKKAEAPMAEHADEPIDTESDVI